MEFRHGRSNGWMLICTCADNDVDDEAFTLEIACELIANTPQTAGIEVLVQQENQFIDFDVKGNTSLIGNNQQ